MHTCNSTPTQIEPVTYDIMAASEQLPDMAQTTRARTRGRAKANQSIHFFSQEHEFGRLRLCFRLSGLGIDTGCIMTAARVRSSATIPFHLCFQDREVD